MNEKTRTAGIVIGSILGLAALLIWAVSLGSYWIIIRSGWNRAVWRVRPQ